jgi:hypothetical protein
MAARPTAGVPGTVLRDENKRSPEVNQTSRSFSEAGAGVALGDSTGGAEGDAVAASVGDGLGVAVSGISGSAAQAVSSTDRARMAIVFFMRS